ncbi:hypothetical protein Tharo_2530 [Thauera aromatica K172]|uniref:Uncharacterized protein n=2 Tax=Thauera aromatica TaxID=59405 RepID=A0A2R4BQ05_THAAR|nr:hypothetical protein Tharo_2530 [Thauera aromatica K172]
MTERPVSKVLVLERDPVHLAGIRHFCDAHNLVGLKVRKNRLMSVLRSNIDLGAILYAEDYGVSAEESREIALQIHTVRPELPIILRRASAPTLDGVDESLRRVCCAAYTANDMSGLSRVIDEFIFCLAYPNALVRGISEITESVLASQFKHLTPRWHTPYIVRDRIIFGEVFSLIPLESNWCRGYMMLQTEEQPILDQLDTYAPGDGGATFRAVNSLLGEITNLIWGSFKNRYVGEAASLGTQIQVPLIVNHKHKYISFGTENPQLCFLYTLNDESTGHTFKLYQRFVFNLNWAPEDFREIVQDTNELVASGELELF